MLAAMNHEAIRFAETLRDPGASAISPQKFSGSLHISSTRLAQLSGVHIATLRRSPDNERLQDYMRDTIGVIGLLLDLNGGDLPRAVYWYRNVPLVELGGETAEQYMAKGLVEGVRQYIINLSAGATG